MRPQTVSVALATYNGASRLAVQLASLLQQSHLPDELVVADDGSSDDTLAVIHAFALDAPFDVAIVEGSGGLGPTRNFERAMQLAKGDVVFCCDQDDQWHPARIERCLQPFDEPTVSIVFCDAELTHEDLAPLGVRLWERLHFDPARFDAVQDLARRTVAYGLTMAFRNTEQIRSLVFPMPMPCGHDNFTALVCAAVGSVEFVDQPLLRYRQHSAQVSGTRGKRTPLQRSITPSSRTFAALAARLDGVALNPDGRRLARYAREKSAHMEAREHISEKPWDERLREVVRMCATGEYHRYSNGLRSAARDVLEGL